MDTELWTPEQIQDKVMISPEEYCFVTGSPLGPVDYYYRRPFDGEELDTLYACAEPTIGYEIEVFNDNAIETLNTADYSLWSLLAVPRDELSKEALNML
jgi:hypothetical protein